MARKRIIKIPKSAVIKCPHCGKGSRINVPADSGIFSLECRKCGRKIETPPMKCCLICAFSGKKCAYSLKLEARAKGLEIRY